MDRSYNEEQCRNIAGILKTEEGAAEVTHRERLKNNIFLKNLYMKLCLSKYDITRRITAKSAGNRNSH